MQIPLRVSFVQAPDEGHCDGVLACRVRPRLASTRNASETRSFHPGWGSPGATRGFGSEECLDLVDLCAGNVEGGVVLPYGLLVRSIE